MNLDGVQGPNLPRLSEEDDQVDMNKVFTEAYDDNWTRNNDSESDSDGTDRYRATVIT